MKIRIAVYENTKHYIEWEDDAPGASATIELTHEQLDRLWHWINELSRPCPTCGKERTTWKENK